MKAYEIDYDTASVFCKEHHRYLPDAPPKCQIRKIYAVGGKRIHAVCMIGNPVSPHFAHSDYEVRRMISDGRMHGAVSYLYGIAAKYAHDNGRDLVTYTFNRWPKSVIASGAVFEGGRKPGRDTRKGRVNATSHMVKYRWRWYRETPVTNGL